jgi:hypothetical protein
VLVILSSLSSAEQVDEPRELPPLEEPRQPLLEPPDPEHQSEHLDQLLISQTAPRFVNRHSHPFHANETLADRPHRTP